MKTMAGKIPGAAHLKCVPTGKKNKMLQWLLEFFN